MNRLFFMLSLGAVLCMQGVFFEEVEPPTHEWHAAGVVESGEHRIVQIGDSVFIKKGERVYRVTTGSHEPVLSSGPPLEKMTRELSAALHDKRVINALLDQARTYSALKAVLSLYGNEISFTDPHNPVLATFAQDPAVDAPTMALLIDVALATVRQPSALFTQITEAVHALQQRPDHGDPQWQALIQRLTQFVLTHVQSTTMQYELFSIKSYAEYRAFMKRYSLYLLRVPDFLNKVGEGGNTFLMRLAIPRASAGFGYIQPAHYTLPLEDFVGIMRGMLADKTLNPTIRNDEGKTVLDLLKAWPTQVPSVRDQAVVELEKYTLMYEQLEDRTTLFQKIRNWFNNAFSRTPVFRMTVRSKSGTDFVLEYPQPLSKGMKAFLYQYLDALDRLALTTDTYVKSEIITPVYIIKALDSLAEFEHDTQELARLLTHQYPGVTFVMSQGKEITRELVASYSTSLVSSLKDMLQKRLNGLVATLSFSPVGEHVLPAPLHSLETEVLVIKELYAQRPVRPALITAQRQTLDELSKIFSGELARSVFEPAVLTQTHTMLVQLQAILDFMQKNARSSS